MNARTVSSTRVNVAVGTTTTDAAVAATTQEA